MGQQQNTCGTAVEIWLTIKETKVFIFVFLPRLVFQNVSVVWIHLPIHPHWLNSLFWSVYIKLKAKVTGCYCLWGGRVVLGFDWNLLIFLIYVPCFKLVLFKTIPLMFMHKFSPHLVLKMWQREKKPLFK